jgi:hypothetical protein
MLAAHTPDAMAIRNDRDIEVKRKPSIMQDSFRPYTSSRRLRVGRGCGAWRSRPRQGGPAAAVTGEHNAT